MSFSYYFKEGAEERFFQKEDVRLVDVIIPSSMIDFPEDGPDKIFVEGLGEITSDDNPIIVMMKMKE